ncbi:MAG: hypothetical protein WBI14_04855 [Anaerolineaceae bacterium]
MQPHKSINSTLLLFLMSLLLLFACTKQTTSSRSETVPPQMTTKSNVIPSPSTSTIRMTPAENVMPSPTTTSPITQDATIIPTLNSFTETTFLEKEAFTTSYVTIPESLRETSCVQIEHSQLGQVVLENDNLYFSLMSEPNNLYKMPIDFQEKSVIYTSQFENGFLNTYPMRFSDGWLLFMDTDNPTGSPAGNWKLNALNVSSGKLIVVTDNNKSKTHLLNFYATVSDNTVFWTQNIVDESNKLVQPSSIHTFNLDNEIEGVLRIEDGLGHINTILHASNGYLVVERDPNIGKAPETINIILINLQTNGLEAIPYTQPGSMPQLQYPYLLWKNNYRFDQAQSFTYYNIETHETFSMPFLGSPNSDVFLFERFPFANSINPINNEEVLSFLIYDILNKTAYEFDPGLAREGVWYVGLNKDYVILNLIPDVTAGGKQTTELCKLKFPFQD